MPKPSPLLVALALGCAPLVIACGRSHGEPPRAAAAGPYEQLYGLTGQVHIEQSLAPSPQGSFFSRPWPTELARRPDGKLDLQGFPGSSSSFLEPFVDLGQRELDGFSVAPTVYFHASGAIAREKLPRTLEGTIKTTSPVFLMDVDPESPERGLLYPLVFKHYDAATSYVPAGTLAARVASGFVLRPGGLYAAVVRRDLGDAQGAPLGTEASLEHIKWTRPRPDPVEEAARRLHQAAFDQLASFGVAREDVAAIALFRTQVPHAGTQRLLEAASQLPPAQKPRLLYAAWDDARSEAREPGGYHTLMGYYCTPNFQQEVASAPFLRQGGSVSTDRPAPVPVPQGSRYFAPECQGMMRARFVLTVPRRPPPPEGFPLMLTAHGTGGDAYSFLGQRDFAGWAAAQGVAVVSTDQPLHGARGDAGARPGSLDEVELSVMGFKLPFVRGLKPSMLFYNPVNPGAARGNMRQATVDAALLLSLFAGLDLGRAQAPDGRPLLEPRQDRQAPRLRADRLMASGHSQGSQSVAALGALDPRLDGVVLSGCGGDTRFGVLHNKEFAQIKDLLSAVIGMAPGELDEFHPVLSLVQTLSDPIDPQAYARLYREPLAGRRPSSVLHFEGLGDSYNPEASAEALAIALRATPVGALARPVEGLRLLGLSPQPVASGNGPSGQSTIAFSQLTPRDREDGHFVIYHEPEAASLVSQIIAGLAAGQRPPKVGPAR